MTEYTNSDQLASIITSRLCHDLANPIGAMHNGIELLELSGYPQSPELELVAASLQNAQAKIGFYRIAFGPDDREAVGLSELQNLLRERSNDGRCKFYWTQNDPGIRPTQKLLLLLALCLETALPLGGEIQIDQADGMWRITAQGERLDYNPTLWEPLEAKQSAAALDAPLVHFHLAANAIADRSITFQSNFEENAATLTLRL